MIEKHTVFGEYFTLGNKKKNKRNRTSYEAMCTCGKIKWLEAHSLRENKHGCRLCGLKVANTSHGLAHSSEYGIWRGLKKY